MNRLRLTLGVTLLAMTLAGCNLGSIQFVPTGQVTVDQDGKVIAQGGITVAPVFTGKYGK